MEKESIITIKYFLPLEDFNNSFFSTDDNVDCNTMVISNTMYQGSREGEYDLLDTDVECSGRQIYRQTNKENYIYYMSTGRWGVGPDLCSTVVSIE